MTTESAFTVSDRPEDRRASPRRSVSLRAQVHLPDDTVLTGQAVDLSTTGVGLYSPRQLQVDQDCRLTIDLSVCGEDLQLSLTGRVCYSREQAGSGFRTGMRFIALEPGAAQLLHRLLC